MLYDTQRTTPFAYISNLHYATLTDIAWTGDGCSLIMSSADGFCSIVEFGLNELGIACSFDLTTNEPNQNLISLADNSDDVTLCESPLNIKSSNKVGKYVSDMNSPICKHDDYAGLHPRSEISGTPLKIHTSIAIDALEKDSTKSQSKIKNVEYDVKTYTLETIDLTNDSDMVSSANIDKCKETPGTNDLSVDGTPHRILVAEAADYQTKNVNERIQDSSQGSDISETVDLNKAVTCDSGISALSETSLLKTEKVDSVMADPKLEAIPTEIIAAKSNSAILPDNLCTGIGEMANLENFADITVETLDDCVTMASDQILGQPQSLGIDAPRKRITPTFLGTSFS